jgi:phosphoadenosine phosphosulfate reductase
MDSVQIDNWNEQFGKRSPQEVLSFFLENFKGEIALSSSLGAEDQVLTEMVVAIDPSTRIFTLDTGRVFPETYDLIDKTNKKYGISIDVYFPDFQKVQQMVKQKGINLFYDSIENRKVLSCPKNGTFKKSLFWFENLDLWFA